MLLNNYFFIKIIQIFLHFPKEINLIMYIIKLKKIKI